LVTVRTTGDRVQDRALAEIGGKALWTKDLDRALLDGEVDACVHSMKDVETIRPAEIAIAAMLPRADVRDRLIGAASIADLPPGAIV
ncbi:hydroxymethylbilane synthase, partial [Pandoraea pneumonica]